MKTIRDILSGLLKSGLVFLALLFFTFLVTGYFQTTSTGRKLNVYIWSAYLAPDTLRNFTDSTGIQVDYDFYDSNEALFAKLEAGNVEYDVIVPSDYMVERMIHRKLIVPLDTKLLPNLKNLDPSFRGLYFDPDGRYSVPLFWGTAALGYRKDKITNPEALNSWKVLADPQYRNHITMLDDMRENFGVALRSLGYSVNSTNPAEVKAAKELLIRQKPLLKEYNSSNFQDLLISGEAWIVHGYNGQIAKAAKEFPLIGFATPKEGGTRSVDNLCIPSSAPHRAEAHAFINYMLGARCSAELCMYTSYSTPNIAAREYLLPETLKNETIFPSAQVLARCEYLHDLGTIVTLYDRYWTEIKSH